MKMEKIIDPVSLELLKAELTPEKKLMDTNRGGNELYVVTWHDSPNVVTEIGRLREVAFREAGGSTGLSIDLDEFDKMEKPYSQLIVWDPDAEKIIGGYRYIFGPDVNIGEDGQPILASSHQFHFSDEFIRDYLPHTMELGRSFVSPDYQSSKAGAKSIFALDNLWDGITSIIYQKPHIRYFFGKMTMYPSLDRVARDLILHFLWKHFGDKEELVRPVEPIFPSSTPELMDIILRAEDFKEDYKLLKEAVRLRNANIPPLVNSYMTTAPHMLMFGTAGNELMNNIEDTAILIGFDDIYEEKKARHIEAFHRFKLGRIRARFPLLDPEMESRMVDKWDSRRMKLGERISAMLDSRKREQKTKTEKISKSTNKSPKKIAESKG